MDSNEFNNESSGETEDGVEGLEAFLETQDKEEFVSESSNENAADLSKFLNDLIEEELGPKIEECLAKAVKKVWNNEINKEKIKNLLKGVGIPGNCEFFRTPQVNPEIYYAMKEPYQNKDIKQQCQQKLIAKAAIPVVNIIHELTGVSGGEKLTASQLTGIKKKALDSFTILSHINTNIVRTRKDDILFSLGKEFRQFRTDK